MCINQMLPEKFSCMQVNFYLLCSEPQIYIMTLFSEHRSKMWSTNPNWGNLSFRKACGRERTLSLLQPGTAAPRPAVQMAWAIHLICPLSLENRWGNTSCQKKGKPLDYTVCSFYRSRLLGRGGKWILGSGGRKFAFSLILLTALAV